MVGNINQNDMEHILDMTNLRNMTPAQANVEIVLAKRFMLVSKLPKDVRSALNKAVKDGILNHKRKEKFKPEVYYHPSFEYLANEARNKKFENGIKALASVMVHKEAL